MILGSPFRETCWFWILALTESRIARPFQGMPWLGPEPETRLRLSFKQGEWMHSTGVGN